MRGVFLSGLAHEAVWKKRDRIHGNLKSTRFLYEPHVNCKPKLWVLSPYVVEAIEMMRRTLDVVNSHQKSTLSLSLPHKMAKETGDRGRCQSLTFNYLKGYLSGSAAPGAISLGASGCLARGKHEPLTPSRPYSGSTSRALSHREQR